MVDTLALAVVGAAVVLPLEIGFVHVVESGSSVAATTCFLSALTALLLPSLLFAFVLLLTEPPDLPQRGLR